jgi:hypothetical protein
MKIKSEIIASLLAGFGYLVVTSHANAATDCSEITKSLKNESFEIAESLLEDGLPRICAFYLAEHLNKIERTKNYDKVASLIKLASRYSDRIKEPELTARILFLKLDIGSDGKNFSKDRKDLRRLDKHAYNKLRDQKKKLILTPILQAAINPLKAPVGCNIPKRKTPWLKFLLGDEAPFVKQCSTASSVRKIVDQMRKSKLPKQAAMSKARKDLKAINQRASDWQKKYKNMPGVTKAHKVHLPESKRTTGLLAAGINYRQLAGKATKTSSPSKKRELLLKAGKQSKVLGFDPKGVKKGIRNLNAYSDALKALARMPEYPINRSKLEKWLKDRNVKRDANILSGLQLTKLYLDCVAADHLEKASACFNYEVFRGKNKLSRVINVDHLSTNVQAKIFLLIHSGWDGIRLDPHYKGTPKAFFASLLENYSGQARTLFVITDLEDVRHLAEGNPSKARNFINQLSTEMQALRGWIEFGKCQEITSELRNINVEGLHHRRINQKFLNVLELFDDSETILDKDVKYRYLAQCGGDTSSLLADWMFQHFLSLCESAVNGYPKAGAARLQKIAAEIKKELESGIFGMARERVSTSVEYRNYLYRKLKFLNALVANEPDKAERLLDKDRPNCSGGFANDQERFQAYIRNQTINGGNSGTVVGQTGSFTNPPGNKAYGDYHKKVLDYVKLEKTGPSSFMWSWNQAATRRAAFGAINAASSGDFAGAQTLLTQSGISDSDASKRISDYITTARSDSNLWRLYSKPGMNTKSPINYSTVGEPETTEWQIAHKKASYGEYEAGKRFWLRPSINLHKQVRRESLMAFFAYQYFHEHISDQGASFELPSKLHEIVKAIRKTQTEVQKGISSASVIRNLWNNAEDEIEKNTEIVSNEIRKWRLAELSFIRQWITLETLTGEGCKINDLALFLKQELNWEAGIEPQQPLDQPREMTPAMKFTLDDLYRDAYRYVENESCSVSSGLNDSDENDQIDRLNQPEGGQ